MINCNERNPIFLLYQTSGNCGDCADNNCLVYLDPFAEVFVRGANTWDKQSVKKDRKALSRIEQRRVIGKLLILLQCANGNEI